MDQIQSFAAKKDDHDHQVFYKFIRLIKKYVSFINH
jgi:hypothetical protein